MGKCSCIHGYVGRPGDPPPPSGNYRPAPPPLLERVRVPAILVLLSMLLLAGCLAAVQVMQPSSNLDEGSETVADVCSAPKTAD